jgi:hypothetical protein
MKVVIWSWRKQIKTDYWLTSWLQLSSHFSGVREWAVELHWKDSNRWWYNLHRRKIGSRWKHSRVTVRLGKYIISVGGLDRKKYYDNVRVLRVINKGKTVYSIGVDMGSGKDVNGITTMWQCPWAGCRWGMYNLTQEQITAHLKKHQEEYAHLNRDYPYKIFWRN